MRRMRIFQAGDSLGSVYVGTSWVWEIMARILPSGATRDHPRNLSGARPMSIRPLRLGSRTHLHVTPSTATVIAAAVFSVGMNFFIPALVR